MLCSNCGSKVRVNDNFCTNCGSKIKHSTNKKSFLEKIIDVPDSFEDKNNILYELLCIYYPKIYNEPFYLSEKKAGLLPIDLLKNDKKYIEQKESFEKFEELNQYNNIIEYKNYYILYFDLIKIIYYFKSKQN